MWKMGHSVVSFEQHARRANLFTFISVLAGIFLGAWLSMIFFKSDISVFTSLNLPSEVVLPIRLVTSIILGLIVVFTFYHVGLIVISTNCRFWQVLKYVVPMMGLLFFWFVPLISILVGIGVAIGLNSLLCTIGYKLVPELRHDDKILSLIVWSGGKDLAKVKKLVDDEILQKLPFIKNRLITAEGLLVKEELVATYAFKSLKLLKRITSELDSFDRSNIEVRTVMGRAYIGLAKARLALEQPTRSAEAYSKACLYGASDESLNAKLAVSYAAENSRTPEAFQAYISYLKQNHDATEERTAITNTLESMCGFNSIELADLTTHLSQQISYAAFGAELTYTPKKDTEKRINEITAFNRAVISVAPDISWAHYYLGQGFLFSSTLTKALSEFATADKLGPGLYPILYYSGLIQASTRNYNEARALFEKVPASTPEYADAQFQIGRLLIPGMNSDKNVFTGILMDTDKTQSAKAISYLDKAIELHKSRPDYYFYAGLAHYQVCDYHTVLELMNREICMEAPPKEFCYLLALTHTALKEYKEARNFLEQTIKIDSSYQLAYSLLGRVWFAETNWAKAEEYCRQAVKLDSSDETARAYLGKALFLQTRYRDTITELKQITHIEDNEIIYYQGRSLMKIDCFEEAIPYLKKLINTERSFEIFYLLGCAYANIGNNSDDRKTLDEALAWFNKAAEIDQPYPGIYIQRANVFLLQGNYAKTYENIQAFFSTDWTPTAISYVFGLYHRVIGDHDNAISEFQKAAQFDTSDYRPLFAQGVIKEEDGDLASAEQLYNSTLRLNNKADIRFRLGIVHSKMQRNRESIAELLNLRNSGFESDSLRYYLGKAYAGSGSNDLAITEWEQLFRTYPNDKGLGKDISTLHRLRAAELFANSEYEESIRHWDTCLKFDDNDENNHSIIRQNLAEAYFRLGIFYLRQNGAKDNHKGREAITKAATLGGRQSIYNYYLAVADISINEFTAAISLLQKLISKEPENEHYKYQLASALAHSEKFEQAVPLLLGIVDRNGVVNYARADILLAECYRKLGKWEQAAKVAEQAMIRKR
jgi:tetratricopeptide (TPR) repeat protein